jgi:hypothetical protein
MALMRFGDRNPPFRRGSGQESSRTRRPGSSGLTSAPVAGRENDALQRGLEKVDEMIAAGRRIGFVQAAENLKNWRDRLGDRVMPSSAFQNESFVLEHLKKRHRGRFIEGARRRFWSGQLAPGRDVTMEWTDSVYAPYMTDLFFALGGFTIHSRVLVGLIRQAGNRFNLQFQSWETDISDIYNWDPGKSTMIPGMGQVTDDEMLALERAGHGRAFKITSEIARITDPEITGDVSFP